MQDLFGQDIQVYRGNPLHNHAFSDEESDKIIDEVIFEGHLLKQMAEALTKLRRMKPGDVNIGIARREAWSELFWVYDLWHSPAMVPFDLACDISEADSELIRAAISHEFADEIRILFEAVVSKFPEERTHLIKKLSRYLDMAPVMH